MPEVHRSKGRAARRLGTAALIAAVVAGAWVLTFSPAFRIRKVDVRGVRHLESAEVIARAGLDGANAWHLDEAAVAARLERDPWVLRAVVVPRLPDAAAITVLERRPLAVFRTVEGDRALVGEGGVVLSGPVATGDLPEVRGAIGQTDPTQLRLGTAVLGSLRPAVRRAVSTVIIALDGSARMTLSSGPDVEWGDVGTGRAELAARARSLGAVLDWAERSGTRLAVVDLHVASAPTATLEDGAVIEAETVSSSL